MCKGVAKLFFSVLSRLFIARVDMPYFGCCLSVVKVSCASTTSRTPHDIHMNSQIFATRSKWFREWFWHTAHGSLWLCAGILCKAVCTFIWGTLLKVTQCTGFTKPNRIYAVSGGTTVTKSERSFVLLAWGFVATAWSHCHVFNIILDMTIHRYAYVSVANGQVCDSTRGY